MNRLTEKLIQIAAVVMIVWYGWSLARETVIEIIKATQRANAAEQRLQSYERQGRESKAP